ncbi:CRISPR-associated endonuclease Cas1 [Stackebrandtia sp.]|jgi:hypothetical protein|uniref:CRISPR-associated endonuclease Cas1 n=1 Tax=Stackebrandtia sp. TaxID=2023065 RepID=UPI0039C8FA40
MFAGLRGRSKKPAGEPTGFTAFLVVLLAWSHQRGNPGYPWFSAHACPCPGQIRDCRTLLRRNANPRLEDLHDLAAQAAQTDNLPRLPGIEGTAARLYFSAFSSMLRGRHTLPGEAFTFDGRNRRANGALSFTFALLVKDLLAAHLLGGASPFGPTAGRRRTVDHRRGRLGRNPTDGGVSRVDEGSGLSDKRQQGHGPGPGHHSDCGSGGRCVAEIGNDGAQRIPELGMSGVLRSPRSPIRESSPPPRQSRSRRVAIPHPFV